MRGENCFFKLQVIEYLGLYFLTAFEIEFADYGQKDTVLKWSADWFRMWDPGFVFDEVNKSDVGGKKESCIKKDL